MNIKEIENKFDEKFWGELSNNGDYPNATEEIKQFYREQMQELLDDFVDIYKGYVESEHIHEYMGIGYYTSSLHELVDYVLEQYKKEKGLDI